MRNRAKCKLCQTVIESIHQHDYVTCKCGEISVDGGDAYCRCSAISWENFLRIDDENNEIIVTIKNDTVVAVLPKSKPTRKELLDMLSEMIAGYERLPSAAMSEPITHYDFVSSLLLIAEVLRADS